MTSIKLKPLSQSIQEEEEESLYQTSPTANSSPSPLDTTTTILYNTHPIHLCSKSYHNSHLVKFQILSCFLMMFLIGLSGQSIGSLIPILTTHYKLGSSIPISLIFIFQFVGDLVSAVLIEHLHWKVGRVGVLTFGNCLILVTMSINAVKPPIWGFVGSYLFSGVGMGLIGSCMNVFISGLSEHNSLMGILHGWYGVGGIVVPLIISRLMIKVDDDFGIFFLMMVCVVIVIGGFTAVVFWREDRYKYEYEVSVKNEGAADGDTGHSFKDVLMNKTVLIFSLYMFFDAGSEASIGSWTINYLIKVKSLDQLDSNYIMSWFWIGITIGRFLFGFVTSKAFQNEYKANLCYTFLTLSTFLIYTTFTLLTTGTEIFQNLTKIMMFIEGLFIGPLLPTSSVTMLKMLPIDLHVSSMGVMSSLGGTGFAIMPFIMGVLTQFTELGMLPVYISILLMGSLITWCFIPKIRGYKF